MKRQFRLWVTFYLVLFGSLGCLHPKSKTYINPNFNFRFVKKVAVLPFENFSKDHFADKKMREILVTTLLASEIVDVTEMGEVVQVMDKQGLTSDTEQPSFGAKDIAKALGQALGVQGIILGSVEEYSIIRSSAGSYPEVSFSLRMIDTKTGTIIWSVIHSEKGSRILPSILGIGEESLTETAIKASEKIVNSFVYKE